MDKLYYQEYYFLERNHWWFKVREGILKDCLAGNIPKNASPNMVPDSGSGINQLKILNIGAATGKTSEMLKSFGEVISIEYDKDCCEFINQKSGLNLINASILEIPFSDASFDIVCAFDVIEHVKDDVKAVMEMKRVCKKNGLIFITVPAFMKLWSHHDVVNRHYRRYIMKQIIALFGENDGLIQDKTYFNSLLFLPILFFRIISPLIPKKIIRKGSGSDFSINKINSFSNKIFYYLFNFERKLLKKIRFSLGVSILFLWKKT
jgi:SAM-dependent methyltransferase